MMPPLDTMNNNDEAFLILLNSQRELLNQLNMENATVRREQTAVGRLPSRKRGSILGVDPFSLMNKPIIERRVERRASVDLLRRMSIGLGNDNYIIQTMYDEAPGIIAHKDTSYDMRVYSSPTKQARRRRSSFGMSLSGLLYEEAYQPQQSRRLSLLSILSRHSEVDDMLEEYAPFEKLESPTKKRQTTPEMKIDIDPKALKTTMESFASAMAKSAKSQQDIHDWDKKMGLKRSHSKTMRMSMRSRKRLRLIMKRELSSSFASTR